MRGTSYASRSSTRVVRPGLVSKHRQCALYVAVAVATAAFLSVLVHVLRRGLGELLLVAFLVACALPFVLHQWSRLDPRTDPDCDDCTEARDRQRQSKSRREAARRRFEAQAESKRQAERRREDVRATAQERHRAEAEFASRHPEAAAHAHERFQQVVHAVRNMPTELWRPVEELRLADRKRYRAPVNVSALCQCSWAAAYYRASLFTSGAPP